MTRHLLQLLCFVILLSCTNHEFTPDPMVTACEKCEKSRAEMQWLETLIEGAKTDTGLMGDIYAVPYAGTTIILHQPIVVSCLACILYDCDGNRIDMATVDIPMLSNGMNNANRIYAAFPN